MRSTSNFKVAPRLASILGDSYTSSEHALKELIDNSWDARATQVRNSVTIDWTLREGARARTCVMVKCILKKYGYTPALQEEVVKTVLAQEELLSAEWAEG